MAAALLLGQAVAPAPASNVRLLAGADTHGCYLDWAGHRLRFPADQAEFERRVRGLDRSAEIHLLPDGDVPYRCIGGIVYRLQAAGVRKIGFISEPPASAKGK